MIQILNLGSTIGLLKLGVLSGYNLTTIESVTWEKDALGYVVKITFVADHGCASEALFIPLRDVSNMPSWTDNVAGANQAVTDILGWITSGTSTPPVLGDILTLLQAQVRTPEIISVTGAGTTPSNVFSISIANVGNADGLVDGVALPAGVSINYDGGGINNTVDAISYNATGTVFIITYLS